MMDSDSYSKTFFLSNSLARFCLATMLRYILQKHDFNKTFIILQNVLKSVKLASVDRFHF
jgi:hypothetical protein